MTAGVVEGVDIDRLRLERRGRLATAMERSRLETVLLMVPRNVEYATGRTASLADEGRARLETAVASLRSDQRSRCR